MKGQQPLSFGGHFFIPYIHHMFVLMLFNRVFVMQSPVILSLGLLCLLALVLLFVLWRNHKKLRQERDQLLVKCRDLEQKVLGTNANQFQYKLNPHLFRNVLNAIQSHVYQSYNALDKLSNVLDYILYDTDASYLTLREEMEFAHNFIEINRLKASPLLDIRIKNRIDVEDTRYQRGLIAPFTCINPIENAFKHADLQSADAFISIIFSIEEGDWFQLSVSNRVRSPSQRQEVKGGLGNKLFRERLSSIYGNAYELREGNEGGSYIAQLRIKLAL